MKIAALVVILSAAPALDAAERLSLPRFRSVAASNGSKVVLRHGPVQQVTLQQGSLEITDISVEGNTLVIDRCRNKCPRGYRIYVEVVTPDVAALSVAEGGWIESRAPFPPQQAIDVDVSNGGAIDIRAIDVARVNASVYSGGRIFTKPRQFLRASVRQGGAITWWGRPVVESSTHHGGVIVEGRAEDADKPLADLGAAIAPPVPPVPPHPPHD